MMKKIFCALFVFLSIISYLNIRPAFAESQATVYLVELGVACYDLGKYEEALSEFNKVLLINPANKTAQDYINKIFQLDNRSTSQALEPAAWQPITKSAVNPDRTFEINDASVYGNREQEINNAFKKLTRASSSPTRLYKKTPPEQDKPENPAP